MEEFTAAIELLRETIDIRTAIGAVVAGLILAYLGTRNRGGTDDE